MKEPTDSRAQSPASQSPAPHPNRQRLLPLFGMAFVLMTVGYYLAISHDHDPDQAQMAETSVEPLLLKKALQIDDKALDTSVRAVNLRHSEHSAQDLELSLRQTSQDTAKDAKPATLRTDIDLDFREEVTLKKDLPEDGAPSGDAPTDSFLTADTLAVTRQYTRVRSAIRSNQHRAIGPRITAQVGELLDGSITRAFMRRDGEPAGFEWVKVPNPQARRMLLLVRDAQVFMTPRYPIGAVNPGESWTYKRPLWVDQAAEDVRAEGGLTAESRFVGVLSVENRRLAVLRQKLDGSARGKLTHAPTHPEFTMTGEGTGTVLVDIDTGNVLAADIDFSRTLTVTAGAVPSIQHSTITMRLRPAEGIEIPNKFHDKHVDAGVSSSHVNALNKVAAAR